MFSSDLSPSTWRLASPSFSAGVITEEVWDVAGDASSGLSDFSSGRGSLSASFCKSLNHNVNRRNEEVFIGENGCMCLF